MGFDSQLGQEIFLFSTALRLGLRPIQLPSQWLLEAVSLVVKWQGCEDDHSLPSSAEVKNGRAILLPTHTPSWH
jgi:hypothetical protein